MVNINRKRMVVIFLCIMLISLLCSCSSSKTETKYTVNMEGKDYEVDSVNKTISDGTYIYQYEIVWDSYDAVEEYEVTVNYPDDSVYWEKKSYRDEVSDFTGGWSEDYGKNDYASGEILCNVLGDEIEKEKVTKTDPMKFIIIIVLVVVGIMNITSPSTAWYLEYGWRYKDAQPSDEAIAMNRFGGIIAIIAAVAILIFA